MKILVLFFVLATLTGAQEKPDSPTPKDDILHEFSPGHWSVENDRPANKAFWFGAAAMGGSSSALWIGGGICRRNNGVEPCTEHYGAYNLWNGLLTGASVLAAPALFYGCRKDNNNARWCWFIPAVVIGANVGWGIHEANIHHPESTPASTRRTFQP